MKYTNTGLDELLCAIEGLDESVPVPGTYVEESSNGYVAVLVEMPEGWEGYLCNEVSTCERNPEIFDRLIDPVTGEKLSHRCGHSVSITFFKADVSDLYWVRKMEPGLELPWNLQLTAKMCMRSLHYICKRFFYSVDSS